jgi:hypothetical protein
MPLSALAARGAVGRALWRVWVGQAWHEVLLLRYHGAEPDFLTVEVYHRTAKHSKAQHSTAHMCARARTHTHTHALMHAPTRTPTHTHARTHVQVYHCAHHHAHGAPENGFHLSKDAAAAGDTQLVRAQVCPGGGSEG